jgi:hypothetical protein
MTAQEESPEEGHERTGIDWNHSPLEDAGDEALALVIEEEKEKLRTASNRVTKALLNEDVPLTGEKVEDFEDAAHRLHMLWGTLALRVPEEYQVEDQPRTDNR